MVQFSEISPQRFLVYSPVDLTDKDFDFVTKKIWHGQRIRPKTFLSFLWSEAKLNSWKLLCVFFISAVLLFIVRDDSLYDLLSMLLTQASTVFFSIYLIFTVTQNQTLHSDRTSFRGGFCRSSLTTTKILRYLQSSQ